MRRLHFLPSVQVPGAVILAALFGLGFFSGTRLTGTQPPTAPSVLVDPGHGGMDGGCGGRSAPILEKELNLRVGRCLAEKLKRYGLVVGMTRQDDRHLGPTHQRDLLARVEHARTMGADLVVCLHADWNWKSSRNGPYVLYHHRSDASRLLAGAVQTELNLVAGMSREALPVRKLLVIREVNRPAILVEMGFLSNKAEANRLAEEAYQQKLADAVATGIIKFLLLART